MAPRPRKLNGGSQPDPQRHIRAVINLLRARDNLTVRDLARELHRRRADLWSSEQMVYDRTGGRVPFNFVEVIDVAEFFGVPFDVFSPTRPPVLMLGGISIGTLSIRYNTASAVTVRETA